MKGGRKLRVYIYAAVDCSHPGGVQTVVEGLERGLSLRGHSVTCAWSEASNVPPPNKRLMRLHVRSIQEKAPRRLVHWPSLIRVVMALLRSRPSIVHVHYLTHRVYYFLLLRKVFGYKLVITVHGSDLLRPWPDEIPYLGRSIQNADGLTAVSEHLARAAAQYPGIREENIAVIPNGVDVDFFSPPEGTGRIAERALRVITVGRLHKVKGQDLLLKAFAKVLLTVPEARLMIVGDGEEAASLRQAVKEMGIGHAVHFAGSLPRKAIRDALRDADLFVLPSRSEGMPVALIEAMACGLPCIATSVGGVPDVLKGIGRLVAPESPDELANAIEDLVDDAETRKGMSANARNAAKAYSSAVSLSRFEDIYYDLLHEAK